MVLRNFQRMLRVIWTYVAVCIILLICLCTGLWTLFENVLRVASESLQNMFEIRWNASSIEFEDGTSDEALQTSVSTNPPSNDSTLDHISSSTISDSLEKVNTAVEIATDKQTEHCQVSPKDNFSSVEGLALQMVLQEQNRMRTDLSHPASSSECYERSQNELTPEKPPVPKSVLKSPSSEGKSRTSTRGTRRIRFQEPLCDVSEGSQSGSISPKKTASGSSPDSKLRKSKTCLNFQQLPATSSERDICNPVRSPMDLQTESSLSIHAKMATNQQLVDEEVDYLSDKLNTNIPSTLPLSSETAENQQTSKKNMDSITEESNSTIPCLSSETTTTQQVSHEFTDPLCSNSNFTVTAALSSETATNKEVDDESIGSSAEGIICKSSTVLSSKTAFNQQEAKESIDSLHQELISTVPTTCQDFKESPEVDYQRIDPETVECGLRLKLDEKSLQEHTPEVIPDETKLKKVELHYESPVKQEIASFNEKGENPQKSYTHDIHGLPEKSKIVSDGQSLQAMNLLPESVRNQSTEESINANQRESTSDEFNPPMCKADEELGKSIEPEKYSKLGKVEATVITDDKVGSLEEKVEATDVADDKEPSREGKVKATDFADEEEVSREGKVEATDIEDEEAVSRKRKVEATDTVDKEKVSREGEVEATDIADKETLREGKEAKVITDDKETSREISTKMLSERENENLRQDSSEKTEGISCIDEEVPLKKDKNVSQASKTVDDDILPPELDPDQQSSDYKCYPVKKSYHIKKKRGKK